MSPLLSSVPCTLYLRCDFVTRVLVWEGPQKMVFIHCELILVVIYSTPILFFYLWTFPPKIIDFVTQIAKFIYKVTIIFLNPQIDYQNPQLKNYASCQTCFRICGLFSTDTRLHLPTSAKCCRIQPTWNLCQLTTLPLPQLIQSIRPILSVSTC